MKVRIEYRLFTDDGPVPEVEGVIRLPWPEGQSFDDVARAEIERVCRATHAPKMVMVKTA